MIEGEFHPDTFLVLPALAISKGECGNAQCTAAHWRVSLGWIVGSVHFYF